VPTILICRRFRENQSERGGKDLPASNPPSIGCAIRLALQGKWRWVQASTLATAPQSAISFPTGTEASRSLSNHVRQTAFLLAGAQWNGPRHCAYPASSGDRRHVDLSSHEVRTAISSGSATRKLAPGRAVACSSTWFPTPRSASEVASVDR